MFRPSPINFPYGGQALKILYFYYNILLLLLLLLRVDIRIILKWISEEYDGRMWIGFIWLKIRTNDGHFCEHG
jgi:hypothetical protein